MHVRTIRTRARALDVTLQAPPSKSVTHRALVAASLAQGPSSIRNALAADDSAVTREGLRALGVEIRQQHEQLCVAGSGGLVPGGGRLELEDSGTSLRLLSAVACMGRRISELDGSARLRERPVEELASALRALGAHFDSSSWPLRVGGAAIAGGELSLPASRSSQFASALMMIAPGLAEGLHLELIPPVVSAPYVELTARVMNDFGAKVEREGEYLWHVRPGLMQGRDFRVEGDHSSASYFLAAAALCGGRVRVDGLDPASTQPDARLGSLLESLGCVLERGADWVQVRGNGSIPAFQVDLAEAPDLAPTVVVLALFAEGPCRVEGLSHLPYKESDRLTLLAENLQRLGRAAHVEGGAMLIGGETSRLRGAEIVTAADHRMAMAFALAGLRLEGMQIPQPDSVDKSNPAFWNQWSRLEGDG